MASARGDEFPPELATEAGRREWIVRELERERSGEDQPAPGESTAEEPVDDDPWTGLTRSGSSRGRRAGRGGRVKRAANSRPRVGSRAGPAVTAGASAAGSAVAGRRPRG